MNACRATTVFGESQYYCLQVGSVGKAVGQSGTNSIENSIVSIGKSVALG